MLWAGWRWLFVAQLIGARIHAVICEAQDGRPVFARQLQFEMRFRDVMKRRKLHFAEKCDFCTTGAEKGRRSAGRCSCGKFCGRFRQEGARACANRRLWPANSEARTGCVRASPKIGRSRSLLREGFQVGDHVSAFVFLLDAGESHLVARQKRARIGDVLVEVLIRPGLSLVASFLQSGRIREAFT